MKDYEQVKAKKFPQTYKALMKKNGKVESILSDGIDKNIEKNIRNDYGDDANYNDYIFQDFWNTYVVKEYGIKNDMRKQMALVEELLFDTEPNIVSKCFGMYFDTDIIQLQTKDDIRRFDKIFGTNLKEDFSIQHFENDVKSLAKRYIKNILSNRYKKDSINIGMDVRAIFCLYNAVNLAINPDFGYDFEEKFCDNLKDCLSNENDKNKKNIENFRKRI